MEITVSMNHSVTIRIKNKTYVLYLRNCNELEVYGAGISPAIPMKINIDDNTQAEYLFKYDESDVWEKIKAYKKELRKLLKAKKKAA